VAVPPVEAVGNGVQVGLELYAGLRGVAGIVASTHRVSETLSDVAEFAVRAIRVARMAPE
jgi:hypothetical protein